MDTTNPEIGKLQSKNEELRKESSKMTEKIAELERKTIDRTQEKRRDQDRKRAEMERDFEKQIRDVENENISEMGSLQRRIDMNNDELRKNDVKISQLNRG